MRLLSIFLFLSVLVFSEQNHQPKNSLFQRPELKTREITDPIEAQKIMEGSEKEGTEWVAASCSKEGCTYQLTRGGSVVEEVFIPSELKKSAGPKSAGQSETHESEYSALNSIEEYEAALNKAKTSGARYMMVKFGAPNHNCLSCLRFDQFMATPELKKFLNDKKVSIFTTDVGEFKNPNHITLAAKLGAQVANDSFHIPYVAVVKLESNPPSVKPLLNGYFGGVSSEREKLREMKRIQRLIE
jgi:hypothetical protein